MIVVHFTMHEAAYYLHIHICIHAQTHVQAIGTQTCIHGLINVGPTAHAMYMFRLLL